MILLWLACFAPDPRAPLAANVGTELAARVPEQRVWLLVDPDAVTVGAVGPFDDPVLVGEPVRFPFETVTHRGMLLSELYDALLARATALRDRGERGGPAFDGELWVFVDRRSDDEALRQVLFTAGQAMFGDFKLLAAGPRPPSLSPPPPAILEEPTPWFREQTLSPLRFAVQGDVVFQIDERPATFSIEVPERGELQPTLMAGLVAQIAAEPDDPALFPSYAAAAEHARYPVLPSLEMLLHVSKQADDALLKAATLGHEAQRQRWLEDSAEAARAKGHQRASAWLATGAALGRGEEPAGAARFLEDPVQSRPLGFYTESAALAQAFRRDRWLAQPLEDDALITELQAVLVGDPFLAADRAHRARWTNPPDPTLPALGEGTPAHVLVPARSHETTYLRGRNVAKPMDAFVAAIRSGEVDLAVRPDSGWYDHAQWALEPLLLPLGPKLRPNRGYEQRLETAFKAAVAMRRETQVKDLALPSIGSGAPVPTVVVAPSFRLEPLPALYQRHEALYAWVEGLAEGEPEEVADKVRNTSRGLQRVFREAAQLAAADLGLTDAPPEPPPERSLLDLLPGVEGGGGLIRIGEPEGAVPPVAPGEKLVTERWLERWRADPALGNDVRVFVPGAKDGEDLVGWAILGVRSLDLVVAYDEPPRVTAAGQVVKPNLVEARYSLLVPYFTELRTVEPLTREALREEASRHATARPLIEALSR